MGFGFPAAIGARFANPGRPVFAIVGDGGFQMTMPELATVKRYQVPVKIVLIDNRNLGMVRQWQELFYDERYSATNLSDNPDFCTIARRLRHASRARRRHPRGPARRARAIRRRPGAMLLHCACFPEENVWPMFPPARALDERLGRRGVRNFASSRVARATLELHDWRVVERIVGARTVRLHLHARRGAGSRRRHLSDPSWS